MANTYTRLYIHIVLVTRQRQRVLTNKIKDEIYKYITGIIQNKHHKMIIINGYLDHVHILIGLHPAESISDLVKEIKRNSTNFINEKRLIPGHFSWQKGYSAFSYSSSSLDKIITYIENQEEHHRTISFKEEYIDFLKKYEIEYDERYLFD